MFIGSHELSALVVSSSLLKKTTTGKHYYSVYTCNIHMYRVWKECSVVHYDPWLVYIQAVSKVLGCKFTEPKGPTGTFEF